MIEDYWLYSQVLKDDDGRAPQFSRQSTYNWMRSLAYEIKQEHGPEPPSQFAACRQKFKNELRPLGATPPLDTVFEPLYSSLNYCQSSISLADSAGNHHWMQPLGVVSWYYALYNAVRAMFAAGGQVVTDTHAAAMKAYASSLSGQLPHPFNMLATRDKGETYVPALPAYPGIGVYDLSRSFDPTRGSAQGMIAQYLNGTAKYYTELKKDDLCKILKVTDFRSKAARDARDKALQPQIGLMHCAFRYRGKANYRDAIYLTYGAKLPLESAQFLDDLSTVTTFAYVCALAYVERRLGAKHTDAFREDLGKNLRQVPGTERTTFWEALK